jgi:glycosyltransferase involved in cell wall biosynthesis
MSVQFSIIVPIYNVQKYVINCLKSIEAQENMDFEVILVNDGSTDNSKELCEKFIEFKNNFYLFSQENKGLSAARNTGIEKAKGEYIIFLDSDDYLNNNGLFKIQKILEGRKVDVLVSRFNYLDDVSKKLSESKVFDDFEENYTKPIKFYDKHVNQGRNWLSAWSCIVKREFLIKNQLFFEVGLLHEDELWVPTIFAKASSYSLNNDLFYIYRINRSGSIMSSIKSKNQLHKIFICHNLNSLEVDNYTKKILNKRVSDLFFSTIVNSLIHLRSEETIIINKEIRTNIILLKNGYKKNYYYIYKIFGLKKLFSILKILYKLKHKYF